MDKDITYNLRVHTNARVKHRQLKTEGTVVIASMWITEALVRWDDGHINRIHISEIDILEKK